MGTSEQPTNHDVVVGGGPAGSSAAVCTARYSLDTVVFDEGSVALRRCASERTTSGSPPVSTSIPSTLMHAHVSKVGCDVITETVTTITREAADSSESGVGRVPRIRSTSLVTLPERSDARPKFSRGHPRER
ncbi:FAD-dependent oxidoreductase [Halogeometricum rufum]|uniref:FAD-dependent oxidoreductase n=1 Tax=Halogeometricum rufum TaxID=553469 RepID=UPI00373FDED8